MIYLIIAIVVILGVSALIVKTMSDKIKKKDADIAEYQRSTEILKHELAKSKEYIREVTEIENKTIRKKNEIRDIADPDNRARAATDAMSKLSRSRRSIQNDTAAGD